MNPFDLVPDLNMNSYDFTEQQFEQEYGVSPIDYNASWGGYCGGYEDGYFGKDPLLQAHQYQCPKFAGLHWVDSYVRADGTVVEGHWRSNPDDTTLNNLKP